MHLGNPQQNKNSIWFAIRRSPKHTPPLWQVQICRTHPNPLHIHTTSGSLDRFRHQPPRCLISRLATTLHYTTQTKTHYRARYYLCRSVSNMKIPTLHHTKTHRKNNTLHHTLTHTTKKPTKKPRK